MTTYRILEIGDDGDCESGPSYYEDILFETNSLKKLQHVCKRIAASVREDDQRNPKGYTKNDIPYYETTKTHIKTIKGRQIIIPLGVTIRAYKSQPKENP